MSRPVSHLIALVAVLGAALVTGVTASAAAELRTIEVRLPDGSVTYVTAEVPPGSCPEDLGLPGVVLRSVVGSGPAAEAALSAGAPTVEVGLGSAEGECADEQAPAGEDEDVELPPSEGPDTGGGNGRKPGPPNAGGDEPPTPDTSDEKDSIPGVEEPRAGDEKKKRKGKKGRKGKRKRGKGGSGRAERIPRSAPRLRRRDGSPARENPTRTVAPAPTPRRLLSPSPELRAVPNFVIEKFRVPIFLLPIYQAAGTQYGVRWEILAAINEIETDYGRNLNVSYAGAVGWMQFLPETWRRYGVDANEDGRRDPYNPVDAIFAAARYLRAAGYRKSVRRAIFAYNHADWYVDSVLMRARLIAGIPEDLTGSLTGLTEGRFPVYARARYADDLGERARRRLIRREAETVASDPDRREIEIYAREGAPVIATSDGRVRRIERRGDGYLLSLQDAYGNLYTYRGLGSLERFYPAPRGSALIERRQRAPHDPRPARPATRGGSRPERPGGSSAPRGVRKVRLFANPKRPGARAAGASSQLRSSRSAPLAKGFSTYRQGPARPLTASSKGYRSKRLRRGAALVAGTLLGRVGRPEQGKAPHLSFAIRPAGRGAPRIDPKPILDGWKLLEETAIYRARGQNVLQGSASVGQLLLLSKPLLERRVLADGRIEIYPCGRQDIRTGQIDRRVLMTLAYLAESGLRPTVSSLKCGRRTIYTSSGSVSNHVSGNAVDIARINGIPVLGHQGRGGVTDQAVRRILQLQGTMRPDEVISLLDYGGPSFALGDHADHIHVGFTPLYGENRRLGRKALAVLRPGQWENLIERIGEIRQPKVVRGPKRFTLPAGRASRAHRGE